LIAEIDIVGTVALVNCERFPPTREGSAPRRMSIAVCSGAMPF
jgi:hypothetical protein